MDRYDEVIITYIIVELHCIYLHIRGYFRFTDGHALAAPLLAALHASNATPRPLTKQQVYHTNTKSATKTREMYSLTETQNCQIVSVWDLSTEPAPRQDNQNQK